MSSVASILEQDPTIVKNLWRATPASMAYHISDGVWQPAPHLELISNKLVDVAMGRIRRLAIMTPPRHGKSELVSVKLPVWYLDTFPTRKIILCSYEFDFAASWGERVRDEIIGSYGKLSVRFNKKRPPAHRMVTTKGGMMVTAGAGGPITGKGADLLIVDDPLKNLEEASSKTVRDNVWGWLTSTALTRLEPGGSVVFIMTRWDEDDPLGRIQKLSEKGEMDPWHFLNFPALIETSEDRASDALGRGMGEPLWEARFPKDELLQKKGELGKKVWTSLYQQRPASEADDGDVYWSFDEDFNVTRCERDPRMKLVWSLDFNVNPMCSVIGQYSDGNLLSVERMEILEEIVQKNSNTVKLCEEFVRRMDRYCPRGSTTYLEVFGDASGSNRSTSSAKTDWQIVAEMLAEDPRLSVRFRRRRANPGIKDRTNCVNMLLKSAVGDRRLLVDPGCKELIADFRKVSWAEDSAGAPKAGVLDKSVPDRTHVSDALGYAVEYLSRYRNKVGDRQGNMR